MSQRARVVTALLFLVALIVIGVAWWKYSSLPDQPSQAEIGADTPFAFVECKARLFDGSPAIALMFTQPLARSQDLATRVKAFEGLNRDGAKPVDNRWVLSDNPRVLVLPFVTPDRNYHFDISADLASQGGGALGNAGHCSTKSEAMPNAYYFASRGIVLPAGQNGGLPVVTVNTPEVDVQFLRVNDDALPRFLAQVGGQRIRQASDSSENAEGDDNSEDTSDAEYGDYSGYSDNSRRMKGMVSGYMLDNLRNTTTSVYTSRFTTDARPNRRNVSFLPVERIKELQDPGIYIAVMNQPGRFGWDHQVTYFYVTDVGLHVRRHATQLDVFATSLKRGEAMRGVDLVLVDDAGKTLAQARTDGDGHALFTGRNDKARLVLARRDKELSVINLHDAALDLSEFDIGGHASRNNKVFVYAGRDLYRPGEQFQVTLLSRDADGRAPQTVTPLTITLKKPDGAIVNTQLARPQATGAALFLSSISLPADAPTGRWMLEARVDPGAKRADTQWTFQVEEFLPERMKLDLKAAEGPLVAGESDADHLSIAVSGNYLYGAPAGGNRLLGSVATQRERNPFAQRYPGFVFGDLDDDSARARQDLGEAALDAQGHADIQVPLQLGERKSPMQVRASFSLLESGGRPVVRSIERTWWPAPVLIGLRPLFDRDTTQEGGLAEFELVRLDSTGKFVPASDVQVKLIAENRNWYWRYDDNRGWHSGYDVNEEIADARLVQLKERSKLAMPVRWGRYRVEAHDPQTGQTLRYRFYAGWGAQDADDIGNRPDRVQLKLEGAPFKPGEVARLTITPPHDGEALVTVEGDKVLFSKRVGVRTKGTRVDIPIEADWGRHDLYVTVAAFRPGSEGDKVTPARALGLVHLPLAREDRKLKVALTAPVKSEPEQRVDVKIKVSEPGNKTDASGGELAKAAAGKTAIVTLSAVDVGILSITNFKSPDPADFFFGKHRFDADLLDFYGKLIEKMDGNRARQRFGGDAGKRDTQSLPRKVKLVDLFSGPVQLDARGEATIALKLPDFNGSLRLMAVVSTPQSYGSADTEMTVAAPIVAELSTPRFITPGDQATLALDLTNLSGSAQDVNVLVEASAPLRIGNRNAALKLADKQRNILRFAIEATDLPADGVTLVPIKVRVNAGKIRLVRESVLQVQPATPTVREVKRLRIEPDGSAKLDPAWADSYWPGSVMAGVSISNQPPIDVREAVRGLLMYPYGCLEQTTSSAYPLVFVDEEGAKAVGLKPLTREERAKRLEGAFGRLASMQQPKGGFGLWSASGPYEAWLSAYVTGFLQDARDAGFAVPETMVKKSLDDLLDQFQKAPGLQTRPPKDMRRDNNGRVADYREAELIRMAHQRFAEAAHTGYILAREQKAPLATLRTLHNEYRGNARSPLPLVQLGIALKLMGDEARAKEAIEDAMKLGYGINPGGTADLPYWWSEWLGDYGSRIRDLALAYALMERHHITHDRRENLIIDLAGDLGGRHYYSTQERLALFLAAREAGSQSSAEQAWQADVQSGTSTTTLSSKARIDHPIEPAALKRGISIVNKGKQPVFIEASVQGAPIKPLPAQADRISIERSWWTSTGEAIPAGRSFKTGEMLVVRLRAQTKNLRVKDALIVDRLPAGFEVENLNLSQGPQAQEFAIQGVNVAAANADRRVAHTEFRDDRFVAAVDLDNRKLDVFYLVRVVTPGRFVVPAPYAEDMYRPEIRGVGKPEADIVVADPRAPKSGGAEPQ